MDTSGEDDSSSSAQSSNDVERKLPNCARCYNHGIQLRLKGHKRFCLFRDCTCEECLLTAERQRVMKQQIAFRRAQTQDIAVTLNNELPTQITELYHNHPTVSQSFTTDNLFTLNSSDTNNQHIINMAQKLTNIYNYPPFTLPLFYAITKFAQLDFTQAVAVINEGLSVFNYNSLHQNNFHESFVNEDYLKLPNPVPNDENCFIQEVLKLSESEIEIPNLGNLTELT
ncbi:unnamed protein product [Diamesa tonsa]